jgi:hypothetical protein
MHTVELLEQAIATARDVGYQVHEDWLGGGGGSCVLKGRKCLFIDLALSPRERLEQVLEALAELDERAVLEFPQPLRGYVSQRRAA